MLILFLSVTQTQKPFTFTDKNTWMHKHNQTALFTSLSHHHHVFPSAYQHWLACLVIKANFWFWLQMLMISGAEYLIARFAGALCSSRSAATPPQQRPWLQIVAETPTKSRVKWCHRRPKWCRKRIGDYSSEYEVDWLQSIALSSFPKPSCKSPWLNTSLQNPIDSKPNNTFCFTYFFAFLSVFISPSFCFICVCLSFFFMCVFFYKCTQWYEKSWPQPNHGLRLCM